MKDKKDEHAAWKYTSDFHKEKKYGKDHGCLWRHLGGWGETACHYAINGFEISKARKDMYNKDHRQQAKAKDLGYATDEMKSTRFVATNIVASQSEDRAFRKKFNSRFTGPLTWLRLDPKGWWVGYTIQSAHLDSLPPKSRSKGPKENFDVYRKNATAGGYGAWYPYHHNHHHMIPQGAFRDYVIYDGKAGDDKAQKRIEVVLLSKWNINHESNVVLLPQEEFIGDIIQLPAHCPWGVHEHAEYSASMKDKLKNVKKKIDDAIGNTKDHKMLEAVNFDLGIISDDILRKIKHLGARKERPGRKLGAL